MKIHECQHCKNPLDFDNNSCLQCHHKVGFIFHTLEMQSIVEKDNRVYASHSAQELKWCNNYQHKACNALLTIEDPHDLCVSCRTNQIIPNLSIEKDLLRWQKIEQAKRRIIYALRRLELPITPKEEDSNGIGFNFIANTLDKNGNIKKVFTGHSAGIITLNIEEADDAIRESHRINLGERYRTLEGHLRHEIGHYYWDRLIRDNEQELQEFRELFGDERADYSEALKQHYASPNIEWQKNYISAYASSHPWEDWAETWAHYLHMIATLETAFAFGISLKPSGITQHKSLSTEVNFDSYDNANFTQLIETWIPITLAINSINRSMGQPDLYPFVLNDSATKKLEFVHHVIHKQQKRSKVDFDYDDAIQWALRLAKVVFGKK